MITEHETSHKNALKAWNHSIPCIIHNISLTRPMQTLYDVPMSLNQPTRYVKITYQKWPRVFNHISTYMVPTSISSWNNKATVCSQTTMYPLYSTWPTIHSTSPSEFLGSNETLAFFYKQIMSTFPTKIKSN